MTELRAEARVRILRPSEPARSFGVAIMAMMWALTSCGDRARTHTRPEVLVTMRSGSITAPDSVRPGWTTVRVKEVIDTHIVVLFRLPATVTAAEETAFVAALDTAPATPHPGVAIGGNEIGARGDVLLNLTPGVYVIACVRRGGDGHRHARAGESRLLRVRPYATANAGDTVPPQTAHDVRMVDFAYVGPDAWTAGTQWLRIVNTGTQDHQLRLARLRDGASPQAWLAAENPDTLSTTVAGMARVGPGEVAYLPVVLTRGTYIAYCLVGDVATHRPHVELGMLRIIEVP